MKNLNFYCSVIFVRASSISPSSSLFPRLLKKPWAADEFISRSEVFTVYSFTVIDLWVVVLLNISSVEKKDSYCPDSYSSTSFFSSTFLVSLLLAYLSKIMIKIIKSSWTAIYAGNNTDYVPYSNYLCE